MTVRRLGPAEVVHLPLGSAPEPSETVVEVSGKAALSRAQTEEHQARERGYRDGFEKGRSEGRERAEKEAAVVAEKMEMQLKQAKAEFDSSRERTVRLFDSLSTALHEHAVLAETVAVEAAYTAIARFLGESYADGDVMKALCRHALSHAGHGVIAVRVSESDVDALSGIDSLPVIGDARLLPGQCTLETAMGHCETGLDVRMDLVKQALLAGLEAHRAGSGA